MTALYAYLSTVARRFKIFLGFQEKHAYHIAQKKISQQLGQKLGIKKLHPAKGNMLLEGVIRNER
jgi:hypothetical protein